MQTYQHIFKNIDINKDYFFNDFEAFKKDILLIQQNLPAGYRICNICGKIYKHGFVTHLKTHNVSPLQWYMDVYQLIEKPKCLACGKELPFNNKLYKFFKFCNKVCAGHINGVQSAKAKNKKYGSDYTPFSWTDEQLKNRGYTGLDDPAYLKICEQKVNSIRQGIIKYGSNFTPYQWTDDQLLARNMQRDSPEYIKICQNKTETSIKHILELNEKIGDSRNPSTWTEQQIINRGYTGYNDDNYLKKLNWRLEINEKMINNNNYMYGYKIQFKYNQKILSLDSLCEFLTILKIIYFYKDEEIIDNKFYYLNTTLQFNGHSAYSDIRTKNKINNIITNWEIHDINDIEKIERKRFCTELYKNKFKFISLQEALSYEKDLNSVINIKKILDELRYSNNVLNKPYEYIHIT